MRRIAVFAVVGGLGPRKTAENATAREFAELTGTQAVCAIDLLPPTRQMTGEQAVTILLEAGIDGVLFLTLTDAYTKTVHTPGFSQTSGSATAYGNRVYFEGQTTYIPSLRVKKPRRAYELALADLRAGDIVWLSSALTRGNAFADDVVMVESLARSVIKELMKERLILPPVPPQ